MTGRYQITVWNDHGVEVAAIRDTLDEARDKAQRMHAAAEGRRLVSVFDHGNGCVVLRLEKTTK